MSSTKEDFEWVHDKIEEEGCEYAIMGYSDWDTIKDDRFHELRKQAINALVEFQRYVADKAEISEDDRNWDIKRSE